MAFPPTGARLDPRNRRILPLNTYLHWRDHGGDAGAAERIWGIQGACQGRKYASPLLAVLSVESFTNESSLCTQKCAALVTQGKHVGDCLLRNLSSPQITFPNRAANIPHHQDPDSGVSFVLSDQIRAHLCKPMHTLYTSPEVAGLLTL